MNQTAYLGVVRPQDVQLVLGGIVGLSPVVTRRGGRHASFCLAVRKRK
jgi:hypothetical protein